MTLVRKTPMARSSIRPQSIAAAQKPRSRKCAQCRQAFDPRPPGAKVCSLPCAILYTAAVKAKRERKTDVARKQALKGRKEWLKSTEAVINRYVLLRDRLEGCCSCPKGSHWDGVWHASHFKSVGSNSALRFNLWNINKGCSQCNLFQGGNVTEYARRIEARHGSGRVDWLKNHDRSRDYTVEYLQRLTKVFNKKCLRIVRRLRGRK